MRSLNFLLVVFISSLVCSCSRKQQNNEELGVLSQEQLSSLLIDIYVAEAVVDNLPLLKDSSVTYFLPFEQKLLTQKNISDSVLRKTYRYYLSHPKELEKVYEVVIDSLTLREQRTKTEAH
jgi:hypothetical protein